MINILLATEEHLPQLVPLFDAYRVFYEQEPDLRGAEIFLQKRIRNKESIIFMAFSDAVPVGFTQLYTSFSSVSLKPIYILNDLYVKAEYRGQKVGEQLLKKAQDTCVEKGYKGVALETAKDNPAQKLYERLDWQKDSHCFHYFWTAP